MAMAVQKTPKTKESRLAGLFVTRARGFCVVRLALTEVGLPGNVDERWRSEVSKRKVHGPAGCSGDRYALGTEAKREQLWWVCPRYRAPGRGK
jgi:hypothetical protein